MGIAEEIARIEREFVPGEVLFLSVIAQEGTNEHQTASWFLRNIGALEALPMYSYNPKKRDFRVIEIPWAIDVFRDFTVGVAGSIGEVNWNEDEDGYEGGWLSSHLVQFFAGTEVPYPDSAIKSISGLAARPKPRAKFAENNRQTIDSFLAMRGHDFVPLEKWLEKLGDDIPQVGVALRLAFDELQGFPPLYCLATQIDATLPVRLDTQDASAAWSELLLSFALDMKPDCFFGMRPVADRWVGSLFVLPADCVEFSRRCGLGKGIFATSSQGEIESGKIDLAAANNREEPKAQTSNVETLGANAFSEKPLGTRERNVLLAIIGVLCAEARIDYTKHSKAAILIQEMADRIGVGIGETTIENHLKKVPSAIATRTR
jgi:hypothetical protein